MFYRDNKERPTQTTRTLGSVNTKSRTKGTGEGSAPAHERDLGSGTPLARGAPEVPATSIRTRH
jgi:hypothetical protein